MSSAIISRLRDIRESYVERKALRRELAAYTTEAELNDIEAALDRYDYTETEEIRGILASQRKAFA
jgi:hypothetical protein